MKDYFSFIFNRFRFKLILIDQIILLFSISISYLIRVLLINKNNNINFIEKSVIAYLIIFPMLILFFYIFGVYEKWEVGNFSKSIVKILFSIVFVSLISGFIFFFIPEYFIGRVVFVLMFLIYFVFLILERYIFFTIFEKKIFLQNVYLLGIKPDNIEKLKEEFLTNKIFKFSYINGNEIDDFIDNFEKNISRTSIIVISTNNPDIKQNIEAIIKLKFKGYFIYDFENFYMSLTGKVYDIGFENVWKIVYEKNYLTNISSYYNLKRIFDFTFSILFILIFLPILIIISLLIKFTSKGPVFFVQERLGWYKKPFKLIKFRTMIVDAEKETGPKWASKTDTRITKFGRFLRFSRLDELPQLINVLKGDMSLVGNRPIREYFAEMLKKDTPFYDLRFFIKPGLTGWSQVKMGYINTVKQQKEKLKYELYYIKNMSFIFDLIILIKTIKTVFNLKGR